jgi:hypothetical protein
MKTLNHLLIGVKKMLLKEMGEILTATKYVLTEWAPKEIDNILARIWIDQLKEFSDGEIRHAFDLAIGSLKKWPTIADIKRLCEGSNLSDEEVGQEVAARIQGAISKFGWNNFKMAEEFIGPIGWAVIQQSGGWSRICEQESDNIMSDRKAWRDAAVIVVKKNRLPGGDLPPSLPQKKNPALRLAMGGKEDS